MINTGQKQPLNKLFVTTKSSYLSSNNNNTYFVDLDTGEVLGLQGLPKKHEYDPASVFSKIKTPGRNNPMYTFSGSEDILDFEISWFSTAQDARDVVAKCKWLESMTKADGYVGRPHLLRFQWGDMYSKAIWIVNSAKYTLEFFDKTRGMFPTCAKQHIILHRYTLTNATHEQINDVQW